MHNVTEAQQRLIVLGYLAEGGADGKFGQKSLDAYNHYRASLGKPPVTPPIQLLGLNADLFPDEFPLDPPKASNPITDYLTGLAIKVVLNKLKGYFPMLNAISGFKTYATGIIMMLVGAADWIGWAIPNTQSPSPAAWVVGGLALCFGRAGLAKVVEDIIAKLGGTST